MNTLVTRLLHLLPPEAAHNAAIWGLSRGLAPRVVLPVEKRLQLTVAGVPFPHPLGLAAGFDKNACALDALLRLGFSHIEAGTVTPLPQAGNPKPRIFRLQEDAAIINRLGFNNAGLEAFCAHLAKRSGKGVVGANIGCNKASSDRVADFVAGLQKVYPLASYVTVNVSSPNTPNLRDMQAEEHLTSLLAALDDARKKLHDRGVKPRPLFLKVAPDVAEEGEHPLVDMAVRHGLSGLIVSNTTVSRPEGLLSHNKQEAGGLSGTPLFEASTVQLRRLYKYANGALIFVGAGGVRTGEDAYAKIRAGASLVQGYTGFIYGGSGYVPAVLEGLLACMERDKVTHIRQAVGADA
ncbi:MAG: quinone-dependent dihydroorotate dehydrogenase [Proteobacteria bacterium]|nr:quinone-dependent dihydroorotate dehydrogenase [Pseudomonadota bacterium]